MIPEINDLLPYPKQFPRWVKTLQGHKYHFKFRDGDMLGQYETLTGKKQVSSFKNPENYKWNVRNVLSKDVYLGHIGITIVGVMFRKCKKEGYITACFPQVQHRKQFAMCYSCLLYTSPSPRDRTRSRMPSSA